MTESTASTGTAPAAVTRPPVSPARLGLLLGVVQGLAIAFLLIARKFGAVADVPVWAYIATIAGGSFISRRIDRWGPVPPGTWRIHVRVGAHALIAMLAIYLTGWGPALGICFVFGALVDLSQCGSEAWPAIVGWSIGACVAGQLMIVVGWMPSTLDTRPALGLAFLGAFAFTIIIRVAASIGLSKELAEFELSNAKDEAVSSAAHHRAIVENAADGILTVTDEGIIASFNAAAERIFGSTANAVVGSDVSCLFAGDPIGAANALSDADSAMDTEGTPRRDVEVVGVRADGARFPMVLSTSSITIAGSAPLISVLVRDVSQRRLLEDRLAYQASHDPLTGLPNRAHLTRSIEQALARVRRGHGPCAVLFVDLDRFKAVNDTLGHAAGDLLLVEAASRLRAATRETDVVSRIGGDEFVVLSDDVDALREVTDLAQRLIRSLEQPYHLGQDIDVTWISASIGIAMSVDGTETPDQVLDNADIAMYRAKDRGRRCFELFDQAMQHWVKERVALESELRHAVDRDELRLFCQPIVRGASGQIVGFEALVRWERPGHGLVPPGEFIPVAEESGLIVDIGTWVLGEACHHAANWARRWPQQRLRISVNVAARQLLANGFLGVVVRALDQSELDPRLLVLEITETMLIDDTLALVPILETLRSMGVSVALDDFGTGFSSLTYLHTLPINVVKIDQAFTQMVGKQTRDSAIVASIIALARMLDLEVIAEGVERPEQLQILDELGCLYLQGYLFSRPFPIQSVPDREAEILRPAQLH